MCHPVGQGLFIPLELCHNKSFFGLRQSKGIAPFIIKNECPGLSEMERVELSGSLTATVWSSAFPL
jgi:hypothetical protein